MCGCCALQSPNVILHVFVEQNIKIWPVPDSHQKHVRNYANEEYHTWNKVEHAWTKLHTYFVHEKFHTRFRPDFFSQKFTCGNLCRISMISHCETTNRICSFEHTLNQSHPTKQVWSSDEISHPFPNLKHAMGICYIFFSSNEYIKNRSDVLTDFKL